MEDLLDRLRLDPGSRTLGQLIQERQWALQEILRLRGALNRVQSPGTHDREVAKSADTKPAVLAYDPKTDGLRLVRMRESKKMVGLSGATIYARMAQGGVPRSVHLGRATAWRLAEVVAWQQALVD